MHASSDIRGVTTWTQGWSLSDEIRPASFDRECCKPPDIHFKCAWLFCPYTRESESKLPKNTSAQKLAYVTLAQNDRGHLGESWYSYLQGTSASTCLRKQTAFLPTPCVMLLPQRNLVSCNSRSLSNHVMLEGSCCAVRCI